MAERQDKNIAAVIADEVAAIEADRDAPIPDSAKVSRGHGRSKTLQVRLNPDEFAELERVATDRGLPTSTVAREAIIRLIRPEVARSAAASRLVDEFARYIDIVGGAQLMAMPSLASTFFEFRAGDDILRIGGDAPRSRETVPDLQLVGSLGDYGQAMHRMFLALKTPQAGGLARLVKLADHDLTYEVFNDVDGQYRFRVKAPGGEAILTSGAFESKSEANAAVADLQETVGDIRNARSQHESGRER